MSGLAIYGAAAAVPVTVFRTIIVKSDFRSKEESRAEVWLGCPCIILVHCASAPNT